MHMKTDVWNKAWLHATILSAMVYGINAALFALTFQVLLKRSKREKVKNGHFSKQTLILLAYTAITFALATLCVASEVAMVDFAFAKPHVNDSPAKVEAENFGVTPISLLGNCAFSVLNWFVNSLLLWRYRVIYRNSTASSFVLTAFPAAMLIGSFVTGTIYLERLTNKATAPSPFSNITFVLIYGLTFMALNLILTLMIIVRLLIYRRRITALVGSHYAKQYTSIASIVIESASLFDLMSILTLIPLVLHNPLVAIPLLIMPQVQALASFLIVYRVGQGTAWLSGTADHLIAQHTDTSTPEGVLSAARFRVTSQMTQASTALNFNHIQSINMLCPAAARGGSDHSAQKAGGFDGECLCEQTRNAGRAPDDIYYANT